MKSSDKENANSKDEDDEINNNIKQIYLNKNALLIDYSKPVNEIVGNVDNFKLNYKRSSVDHFENKSDYQPLFEPLKSYQHNQNETVELQRLISTGNQSCQSTSTTISQTASHDKKKDDSISRKASVTQDSFLDKRNKRKTSTVLELKNYDQWTEEQKQLNLGQNKLDLLIKEHDKESNKIRKKKSFLRNTERNRTYALVFMLAFLILSMVIYSNFLEKDTKNKDSKEYRIKFRENELRTFDLLDENGNKVLTIHYGLKIPKDLKPIKCSKLSKGCKFDRFKL